MAIQNVITDILESTGYKAELMEEGEVEAETRLENISELSNKAVAYWEDAEEPTLDGFLEEVALVADIDSMDESEDRVVLMTLHSAKGLEFPYVYMSGLEDGLFPSSMAMSEDPEALEEDANAFCLKAKKYDLILVPSDNFGVPGYFRMAYCIDTEKVQRSIPVLEKFVAEEYGVR